MGEHRKVEVPGGTVTILRDGEVALGAELFSDLPDADVTRLMQSAQMDAGPVPAAVNGFLYQTAGRNILIDAGGRGLMPGLGSLGETLAELNVAADQIDTVYLTHIHPDHIGGLIADGAPVFPNAKLMLHQDELAFWTNPDLRANLPPGFQGFFDFAQIALGAYGDHVTPFAGESEVTPLAHSVHLPGHTPGHSGLQIGSGEAALFIWGDIIHVELFQLAIPEASIAFDVDPQRAVATRKSVLARTAAQGTRVTGGHLSGVGRIDRAGDGYGFNPDQ